MSELSDTIRVIGPGSPIMSDDAIGLEVADEIERMGLDGVETRQEPVGGLDIIPLLWGYRNVIIVDAIQTRQYDPGTIMFFDPEDFDDTVGDASAHDINLATGMRIGREVEPFRCHRGGGPSYGARRYDPQGTGGQTLRGESGAPPDRRVQSSIEAGLKSFMDPTSLPYMATARESVRMTFSATRARSSVVTPSNSAMRSPRPLVSIPIM